MFVVVIPAFPSDTEVALVLPRFKAAAESRLKAPALVDQVEAAFPVIVRAVAAPELKVTAPAPVYELPAPILTDVGVMAPKVKAKAPAVLEAETPFPVVTELTKVPEVGRVTEVVPVVRRESALVAEKVTTSPPPKVIAFVARVVESETARVLPAVIFKVFVPLAVGDGKAVD